MIRFVEKYESTNNYFRICNTILLYFISGVTESGRMSVGCVCGFDESEETNGTRFFLLNHHP